MAHDWDAEQDGRPDTLQVCDEATLRKALDGPLLTRPLPGHLGTAFRQHTRERAARLLRLAWWDWSHERLRTALPDFRALPAEAFLDRYEGRAD